MADESKQESIVEVAKKRYLRAKDAYNTLRQMAVEDTRFVMGDSENRYQWPENVYEQRALNASKPCLTINITAQHCNQVINNIRQNRPSAKVVAVDNFSDPETAEILGGMLRSIQSFSSADTAHDLASEHAVYGGEGYWRILTEYEHEKSFDQVITVKSIVNPQLVYIDPDSVEPDRSDARWCFLFEDISREQAKEDHPKAEFASWAEDRSGWVKKDTIRRAEYYWCEDKPDTLLLLGSGETILTSELPEGAQVSADALITSNGQIMPVVDKRDTCKKVWYWCKLLGGEDEPIDKKEWPGQFMPIITVVGKELNINGEIIRKGIVRDLKDSARMVNYSYSSAIESLALQNDVPYMAAAEAIEGHEAVWGAANINKRAYLPFNALDSEGNPLPVPQRQPSATMPTAQVQMLQLSVEQMRASSGQQNANFGIKSEAASGVGIQRLKAQGEIATFHFPDNLARALKYEAKVILDLIGKVYTSDRIVRILGLDGKEQAAQLAPGMQQAYHDNPNGKVAKIFNPSVGRYDVTIDTGPSYQTMRQEASENLTQLTSRNPALMQAAGDLVMRAYDFPMAQEIADRLQKTIDPKLLDDGKGKPAVPPEIQQAMDQMQQQMQAMDQALSTAHKEVQKLESESEFKQKELLIKAFGEETKRLQVIGTAMTPEAVQQLVMQTLESVLSAPPLQQEIAEPPEQYGQEQQEPPQEDGSFMPEELPPEMDATGANPGLSTQEML
jgi:hypothetical protein